MEFEGLNLTWFGHSSFLIKNKLRIYIDPYQVNSLEKADIILITHSHYDHCSIEDLRKIIKKDTSIIIPVDCQSKISKLDENINVTVLEPGKYVSIKGVDIKAVPAYNVDKQFHERAESWNGYVLNVDGKKIYHAGDTDLIPEMSELEGIDIALLPVSGVYVMTAEEAARAAILIRPKLSIPMHYSNIVGSEEDALRFMERCEQEGVSCKILESE